MEKKIGTIRTGSKVFLYHLGTLREHEVIDICVTDADPDTLVCKVLTHYTTGTLQEYIFTLDAFIKSIMVAQDMKIRDIDR